MGIANSVKPQSKQTIPPCTVGAGKFSLINSNGTVRATLAMFEGVPSLDLSDSNGTARASLAVFNDGPALNLYDSQGIVRTMVSDGLISMDADSNNQIGLSTMYGEPNILISDIQGFKASLGVTDTVTTGNWLLANMESEFSTYQEWRFSRAAYD